MVGELCTGTDEAQIFEHPQLVRSVHGFQTTLAQLTGMCKGHCMCLLFLNFIICFLKKGICVVELLYVSFDAPIFEFSSGLDKVVVHGQWPQEDSLKPWQEWFDGFRSWVRLCIDLKDVGRRTQAIIVTESSNSAFVK